MKNIPSVVNNWNIARNSINQVHHPRALNKSGAKSIAESQFDYHESINNSNIHVNPATTIINCPYNQPFHTFHDTHLNFIDDFCNTKKREFNKSDNNG